MAAALNFSGHAAKWQRMNFKAMKNSTPKLGPIPQKPTFQQLNEGITYKNGICMRRKKIDIQNGRCIYFVLSSTDDDISVSSSFPASDVIMSFYSSINEKNLDRLKDCISKDCFMEDLSFPHAFQGSKEAMKFFDQLTKSMGQNVEFRVENICEGDGYTAAVNWHLEWKGRKIPFTRGCSFYEFAEEGQSLVIRKARILIESPIKPGGIVLTLLKNVTFLFDEFPRAAEWFLEKPYAVIIIIGRIYGLFMAPFINHILAGYLKLLNLLAQFFLLALKIIIKIRSFFSK